MKEITRRGSETTKIEDLEPQADPKGGGGHQSLEGDQCLVFYLGGTTAPHTGGANVALGDGSVRFVQPSVGTTGK